MEFHCYVYLIYLGGLWGMGKITITEAFLTRT